MPRYRLSIDVPVFIDRVIVWPVLAWRWFWYDHTYRRVKLLPDKYAKVEPRDYYDVSKYTWWARKTPRSYTAIRFIEKGRVLVPVHMHRQIMLKKLKPESGELPANLLVDHKNRDATDNRRVNLRLATTSQNSMNRRKCKGTSSKYKGVSWDNRKKLWKAAIQIDRKNRHLGYFESEMEAAKVYDKAARKYHGEFAYQNFEDENRQLTRRAKIRKVIIKIIHKFLRQAQDR